MSAGARQEDLLGSGIATLGQDIDEGGRAKLLRLVRELARWNRKINLTAIRDPDAMIAGHLLDSLAVRPWLAGKRVIDIGTGPGFPGLPLAITEPSRTFDLLDSNGKKISFVRHMIADLRLPNATAVNARAEDYAPDEGFDTVIARALASLREIVTLAGHLVREDGVVLALKGKHPAEELESINRMSGWKYVVTEITVPGLESHARHVVCLRKQKAGAA